MWRNTVFGLFLLMFFESGFSAGLPFSENRFSVVLEYQIMSLCLEKTQTHKTKAIKVCTCALEKTMENGWLSDYDNNKDYWENRPEFISDFEKNRKACQENYPKKS